MRLPGRDSPLGTRGCRRQGRSVWLLQPREGGPSRGHGRGCRVPRAQALPAAPLCGPYMYLRSFLVSKHRHPSGSCQGSERCLGRQGRARRAGPDELVRTRSAPHSFSAAARTTPSQLNLGGEAPESAAMRPCVGLRRDGDSAIRPGKPLLLPRQAACSWACTGRAGGASAGPPARWPLLKARASVQPSNGSSVRDGSWTAGHLRRGLWDVGSQRHCRGGSETTAAPGSPV